MLQKLFKNQCILKANWPKKNTAFCQKTGGICSWRTVKSFQRVFQCNVNNFLKVYVRSFFKAIMSGNLAKTCRHRHIFSLTLLYRNKSNFFYCTLLNRAQLSNLTMNDKLSPHRFWPCHENGLIKANDTPQPICEFQVDFPLLWMKDYPGSS